MSLSTDALTASVAAARRVSWSWPPRFLRKPGGILGTAWLLLLAIASATAPLWRPDNPNAENLLSRLKAPSGAHLLGTDELGRDLLTRIFTASGPAILSAAVATVVALFVAVPFVLLAAEYGRRVERATTRGAEVLLALPTTVILLALYGALGDRSYLIMAILGFLVSATVYRVLLGIAQSLHQRLYIDAARVEGAGPVRIAVRYVLPGMGNVIAVQAAQLFAVAILVQSGLAFMGFGPNPPTPSWGGMISEASEYIYQDPWMLVPTGVILALTVLAANALADAIADSPASRRRRQPRRARAAARLGQLPPKPVRAPGPAPDSVSPPLLEVRGLSLQLADGPELVTDLSLTLGEQRVLGLIGESGCGKTITALSLLGLLPPEVHPTAGSIRYQGRELLGLSESELRPMRGREFALIPQDPMVALDPLFTVGAQMTETIRRLRTVGRAEARRIAVAQLTSVEIADPERVLRSRPYELSGGMAQRVMIALALVGEPRVLIADEPTTALDVTVQMEILDLLRSLVRDTGVSVLIVSHDMGVIADICDEVAVMYAGQIVEQGSVSDVLSGAWHPYTGALLAATPHIEEHKPVPERLVAIAGQVPRPGDWPSGCRFQTRCPFAGEECRVPVVLEPMDGDASARCVKAKQLRAARNAEATVATPSGRTT